MMEVWLDRQLVAVVDGMHINKRMRLVLRGNVSIKYLPHLMLPRRRPWLPLVFVPYIAVFFVSSYCNDEDEDSAVPMDDRAMKSKLLLMSWWRMGGGSWRTNSRLLLVAIVILQNGQISVLFCSGVRRTSRHERCLAASSNPLSFMMLLLGDDAMGCEATTTRPQVKILTSYFSRALPLPHDLALWTSCQLVTLGGKTMK